MVPGSGRGALNERATWLAALLFAAITLLLAYPISIHPVGLRFPTGPDGDLGWYLLGWDTHALFHRPWAIFDANIYYPERFTLAFGENIIGLALLASPVIGLGGNLLLAANFVSLASTVLCGVGAYLLARRVGVSVAGAIICGIIFLASPPRFLRIGQINLSSVQWIAFTLVALHAYLEHGRKRDLRLAAAFFTLEVLSSGHGAVFLTVVVAVFLLYHFALGEPLRLVKRVRDLGIVGLVILLPSILVFIPYLIVQREVGLRRGLGSWTSNYASFLASPSHVHTYLLDRLGLSDVNATANAFLFPGYLPLALAAVALLWPAFQLRWNARRAWTTTVAVLEAALLASAVLATALTIASIVPSRGGTTTLGDPAGAMTVWFACIGLALIGLVSARVAPAGTLSRHVQPLTVLLVLAASWIGFGQLRSTMRAGDGLRGEYFRNAEWQGAPDLSVADTRLSVAAIKARWSGKLPEQFSVRWNGFLTVPRAGVYHFATTSDDGSRLFINRGLIVDNSGIHPAATQSGSVRLGPGSHLVELEYSQVGGLYDLQWTWSTDGKRYSEVPGWLLSQRQTHYSTAVSARIVGWAIVALAIACVAAAWWYSRAVLKGRAATLSAWAEPRRTNPTLFYGVLTFVTLWLTIGPPFGLWRYVYWLPGFSFIRVNTRFMLVVLLGLGVLAGIGFDRMARRLTPRGKAALAMILGVLLLAEFAAAPLPAQPSNFNIPAVDRWMNTLPKPFVVAEVPVYNQETQLGAFERQEVNFMIHSTAHWQKTVHGYSGWRTAFHSQLYWKLMFFPDERSLDALDGLGVTYVVVHTDNYPPAEWEDVEARLREFSSRLKLIREESGGRVYRLLQKGRTR